MSPRAKTYEEVTDAERRLVDVVPEGWYARGLTQGISLDGREPLETWAITFGWGAQIEGGRTMYYAGGSGTEQSVRFLEVNVEGRSIDDLISAATHLKALEPIARLPWPIEFDIRGWLR